MDEQLNLIRLDSGRQVLMQFTKAATVLVMPIFDETLDKDPVGRAIVLVFDDDRENVMLLDIAVFKEQHRRMGIATDMLSVIKDVFPHIETQWYSKGGKELCLKNGFALVKPIHKRDVPYLAYHRDGPSKIEKVDEDECSNAGEPAAGCGDGDEA